VTTVEAVVSHCRPPLEKAARLAKLLRLEAGEGLAFAPSVFPRPPIRLPHGLILAPLSGEH
jgi:hypothetical protein